MSVVSFAPRVFLEESEQEEIRKAPALRPVVTLCFEEATFSFRRPGFSKELRDRLWRNHSIGLRIPEEDTPADNDSIPIYPNNLSGIQALWERCHEQRLLLPLYQEIAAHPTGYLFYNEGIYGRYNSFVPLAFAECACTNASFNRITPLDGFNRRKQLEQSIIAYVREAIPDRTETVRFMDLGCGNLLQTWLLIGQLMREGYTDFEVGLVDPRISYRNIDRFLDFYTQFEGVKVEATATRSISKLEWENEKVHFIAAVDFELLDGRESLVKTLEYLREGGKMFMGFNSQSFVYGLEGIELLYQDRNCAAVREDLKAVIPEETSFVMIHIRHDYLFPLLFNALVELEIKGIREVKMVYDHRKRDVVHKLLSIFFPSLSIQNIPEKEMGRADVDFGISFLGNSPAKHNYIFTSEGITIVHSL